MNRTKQSIRDNASKTFRCQTAGKFRPLNTAETTRDKDKVKAKCLPKFKRKNVAVGGIEQEIKSQATGRRRITERNKSHIEKLVDINEKRATAI